MPNYEQLLKFLLPFCLVLLICILFKEQIKALFNRFDFLTIKFPGLTISMGVKKFKQGVQELKAQAKGVEKSILADGSKADEHRDQILSSQMDRDAVLLSWGAVKQAVFDACIVNKMPLTPATGLQDAIQRLAALGIIDSDFRNLLNVLHNLGKELAGDASVKPLKADARTYMELAYAAVDWIMLNIVSPKTIIVEGNKRDHARQATVVGEHFQSPNKSRAAAILIGLSGPLQDRRFPVDKDPYNIGRNHDNDLPITGDDFVSGKHAGIKYDNGALFMFDQGSRNGTFLNGKRVTSSAVSIRLGDTIRLGNSIFQVTDAPQTGPVDSSEPPVL